MGLQGNDLALLTARFGVARFGASRFGFIPCPEDVEGVGNDEPGEYIWREVRPPTTEWTLVNEDCVCRNLCTLELESITAGPTNEYDLRHGLIHYWNLGDATGTGDRADFIDSVALTPSGVVTKVAAKSGNGALVPAGERMTTAGTLDWTAAHSTSVWFNFEDSGATSVNVIVGGTSLAPPSYPVLAKTAAGTLNLITTTGNTFGTTVLGAGTWHHVVLTNDGAGQYRVYLNGALELSRVDATVLADRELTVQASVSTGDTIFDEIGRYEIEMDAAQITGLYAAGSGLFFSQNTNSLPLNENVIFSSILSGVLGKPSGVVKVSWGDGGHSKEVYDLLENGQVLSFTHRYNDVGDYTITFTIWDERGCSVTQTLDVTVAVAFSVTVSGEQSPCVGQGGLATVPFTYTIDGGFGPFTYLLERVGGGEETSTDPDPTVQFSGPPGEDDTVSYILTVTDDLGNEATYEGTVDVTYCEEI